MSVKKLSTAHTLPSESTWLEFPQSDGPNLSSYPSRTQRIVDSDGQVNFMRPVPVDESAAIHWRVAVGAAVAKALGMRSGPNYVLKSWPDGYQLFDHNKGAADNPRHDLYLYGSRYATRFRSAKEFVPHAIWLFQDPTMNTSNCGCKYCDKKPQKEVSQRYGLSQRVSSAPSARATREREKKTRITGKESKEKRSRVQVPHAAIRKPPRPVRTLTGPSLTMALPKDNDVIDALRRTELRNIRYHRTGELVWCALPEVVIGTSGSGEDDIVFWPGLVQGVVTKSVTSPKSPEDVQMSENLLSEVALPTSSKASSSNAPQPQITWTIRQHNAYKIALMSTAHSITVSDEDILPYLAYAPSDALLAAIHREILEAVVAQPLDHSPTSINSINLMGDFNPVLPEEPRDIPRFKKAAKPFTLAVQMASKIARMWGFTDEWECKQIVPTPGSPPPQPTPHATTGDIPSFPDVLNKYQTPPSPTAMGVGSSTASMTQSASGISPTAITQTRFQGLWWGAERIWTDELVRLKLARCQFAPEGSNVVYPVAGPSKSTIELYRQCGISTGKGEAEDGGGRAVSEEVIGAGDKGMFMRIEGLILVDAPRGEGDDSGVTKECRALGMLYELVEDDWEDPREQQQSLAHSSADNDSISTATGIPSQRPTPTVSDPINSLQPSSSTQRLVPTPSSLSTSQQLSHPVLSMPYPLPEPPTGFRFHAILPHGHEAVISLALVAGRYYPTLLTSHPRLLPAVQKMMGKQVGEGDLYAARQLWALDGIVPGVHQSMEPLVWKQRRYDMITDADHEAKEEFALFGRMTREREGSIAKASPERQIESSQGAVPTNMQDHDTNATDDLLTPA